MGSCIGPLTHTEKTAPTSPRATLTSHCFQKWTPLKIAILFNQSEAVGELLNHWQSVDVQDVRLAVKYGSAKIARVLYDSLQEEKEDLAIYPRDGNAVLINYDPEDLAYLVKQRVISPAWLLQQIGNHGNQMIELIPLVVSQGVPITQVLRTGLQLDNTYLVEWAVKQNPPLQQIDSSVSSPFMVAAEAGNTLLAKQLCTRMPYWATTITTNGWITSQQRDGQRRFCRLLIDAQTCCPMPLWKLFAMTMLI